MSRIVSLRLLENKEISIEYYSSLLLKLHEQYKLAPSKWTLQILKPEFIDYVTWSTRIFAKQYPPVIDSFPDTRLVAIQVLLKIGEVIERKIEAHRKREEGPVIVTQPFIYLVEEIQRSRLHLLFNNYIMDVKFGDEIIYSTPFPDILICQPKVSALPTQAHIVSQLHPGLTIGFKSATLTPQIEKLKILAEKFESAIRQPRGSIASLFFVEEEIKILSEAVKLEERRLVFHNRMYHVFTQIRTKIVEWHYQKSMTATQQMVPLLRQQSSSSTEDTFKFQKLESRISNDDIQLTI